MTALPSDLNSDVRLRAASSADLPAVREVVEESGLTAASLSEQDSTFWLALREGKPVGVIGLEHGEHASLLRSAAVLPSARGDGIGRALAMSALTHATLRGDEAVYLFSSSAGGYWREFGFEEVPVAELVEALPEVPQVQSGKRRGWLSREVAWRKTLKGPL